MRKSLRTPFRLLLISRCIQVCCLAKYPVQAAIRWPMVMSYHVCHKVVLNNVTQSLPIQRWHFLKACQFFSSTFYFDLGGQVKSLARKTINTPPSKRTWDCCQNDYNTPSQSILTAHLSKNTKHNTGFIRVSMLMEALKLFCGENISQHDEFVWKHRLILSAYLCVYWLKTTCLQFVGVKFLHVIIH